MGVAQGHLDVLVAQDLLERLQPAAAHHEPGGEVMPRVMEVEIAEPGGLDGVLERAADLPRPPDRPSRGPGSAASPS